MMVEKLLTPNQWSRPQKSINTVKALVLHWFMAPGHSARAVWQWWESRKAGDNRYGSAHIIIDDTETIIAVPLDEVAYHVGTINPTAFALNHLGVNPNRYSIGIELSHDDWTGKPTDKVWDEATDLCAKLCKQFKLSPHMIVTHFDITGMLDKWNDKPCHRWFVEQPGELSRFRADVKERL